MERERRTNTVDDIEIRTIDDVISFKGHPAVFRKLSQPIFGLFQERVGEKAFDKTIREADVRMLVNHEGVPVARTKSGTLRLSTDNTGLFSEAPELDGGNPTVQELASAMGRKDLDQMSFGFRVIEDAWEYDAKPFPIRTLVEVELFDVSPVTFPAYTETDAEVKGLVSVAAEVRSLLETRGLIPDEERAKVDESAWDGNAAMSACDEAACYRAICAGETTVGGTDERRHWKLPHHKTPDSAPNRAGVRNALSRLPQTKNLKNAEAARKHLDRHMAAINPDRASEYLLDLRDLEEWREVLELIARADEEDAHAAMEALRASLAPATEQELEEFEPSHYRSLAAAEARVRALKHSAA